MRTTAPRNELDQLAADATRLAQAARQLQRQVTEAVDRIAATDAREAALRLEDLADMLADAELDRH